MIRIQQSLYFLHGLESSGSGTKGKFFSTHFPSMKCPDFTGALQQRLSKLEQLCSKQTDLILVGSSFGGLMACCFAQNNKPRINRLILMAPALNFEGYVPPPEPLDIPTLVIIGKHDDVTPMDPVLDLAAQTFTNLTTWVCDDDHMLHASFFEVDWSQLLDPAVTLSALAQPANTNRGC